MTHGVITFILALIAIGTFVLKGKQWPTFITATLFGIYLGSTFIGEGLKDAVETFLEFLTGRLG